LQGIDEASPQTESSTDIQAQQSRPVAVPESQLANADESIIDAEVQGVSWATSVEDIRITTPQSTVSGSTFYSADVAPWRWLGLVAGDATGADYNFIFPASGSGVADHTKFPAGLRETDLAYDSLQPDPDQEVDHHEPETSSTTQTVAMGSQDPRDVASVLHDPAALLEHGMIIFRHFVDNLSHWIDLTNPERHFSITVPQLAMHNKGLMKAVLALSSRHLSVRGLGLDFTPDRTLAVHYYNETLQYLQQAMKDEVYLRSQELLATVLIISTYEMIDGAGKGWERHLKGVFWIQRSQNINGESGGLKQAIWWAWLRQDVWAAFRERRKVRSFFTPTKPYLDMDAWDLVNRPVYLLAQCVNYGSDQEMEAGKRDLQLRMERADELLAMLEEWRSNLTPHYRPLPTRSNEGDRFKPIWINPPAFGMYITGTFGRLRHSFICQAQLCRCTILQKSSFWYAVLRPGVSKRCCIESVV